MCCSHNEDKNDDYGDNNHRGDLLEEEPSSSLFSKTLHHLSNQQGKQ